MRLASLLAFSNMVAALVDLLYTHSLFAHTLVPIACQVAAVCLRFGQA